MTHIIHQEGEFGQDSYLSNLVKAKTLQHCCRVNQTVIALSMFNYYIKKLSF